MTIKVKMITFTAAKKSKLIKSALENCSGLSYSAMRKALRNKDVKVNGARVKEDVTVFAGDMVEIFYDLPKTVKYETVYKDENVLVVNKKAGYGSEEVFADILNGGEAYFIHRLDRNTSGIMIFALNKKAERELLSGFKNRTFEKYYRAEVKGFPPKDEDELTAYLKKDAATATVKVFPNRTDGAVRIKTGYKVLSRGENTSVLRVKLFTGKTHQIRAHLAFIGCPVLGDGKYGDAKFNKERGAKTQVLSAETLVLHFKKSDFLYYLDGKTFSL